MLIEPHNSNIYIFGFWADYEHYFFNQYKDIFYELKDVENLYPIMNYFPRFIKNITYKALIKKKIKTQTNKIFIVNEHRLILNTINEIIQKDILPGIVLLRNPMNSRIEPIINSLQNKGVKCFSFDKNDCKKYNFFYYNQFITFFPELLSEKPTIDIAFMGRDKNRYQVIKKLTDHLKTEKISSAVKIIENNKNTSYYNYLLFNLQARCILDINQEGQSGLTLRPLEALFYRRKLITNNISIINEPFYNSNNIFIIENMQSLNIKKIKDFLSRDLVEIADSIKEQYTTSYVIHKILTTYSKNSCQQ